MTKQVLRSRWLHRDQTAGAEGEAADGGSPFAHAVRSPVASPCSSGGGTELAVRAATIYPGRAAQGTQTTTMSRNTIRCER